MASTSDMELKFYQDALGTTGSINDLRNQWFKQQLGDSIPQGFASTNDLKFAFFENPPEPGPAPDPEGVTWFKDEGLPEGWTSETPAGSVLFSSEYLTLKTPAGAVVDSISSAGGKPQGPMIQINVDGPFDYAVALAEEPNNLANQGIDLLALGEDNTGARFCLYSTDLSSSFRNDHNYYVFDGSSRTVTGNTSALYGAPGWLRLKYDGTDFTFYQSRTALPGSWVLINTHAAPFVPAKFAIHAIAYVADSYGREQRIAGVVDMTKHPSEDVFTSPVVVRTDDNEFDGTNVLGTVATVGADSAVEVVDGNQILTVKNATAGSSASVMFEMPTQNHGMLLRYKVAPGFTNAFWVAGVGLETTTSLEGAKVVSDKWGAGDMMLMEMPARITSNVSGNAGVIVRMLRRSPVPLAQEQVGTREFDGYSMLIEDLNFPVGTEGGPWTWMRLEKVGYWTRVRIWLDGEAEPDEWSQMLVDCSRRGSNASLSLGFNDASAGGTDTATVSFSDIVLYSVETA